MHTRFNRPIAATLALAVAVTSFNLGPAQAAPKNSSQPRLAQSTSTTSDFSARRHWHRGNRAALGAFIGVFGAIAAMAAADRYRDDYYYGDPGYGPYAYGYGGYSPGYRFGGYHRHHHHH